MLPRSFTRLLLIAGLFSTTIVSAQQKWPATMLWKISGNGLEKPSYLYGTIHLQDKRLFQFGDSLYHSLESVEGFALEVDFREFFDSIFNNQIHRAEQEFIDEEPVTIDRKKLDRSSDSLLKKMGINKDVITRKELKRIRDYRMNRIVEQGDMQTIVDGYLYGLALRQNKWMGGIEDVNDQINLMDEYGRDLTPEEVFQPESNIRSSVEQMVKTYQAQNLDQIAMISDQSMSAKAKDEMLIRRNIKMARRMDSLSDIRTMFFAVGCAHLPGDSGVINLLRSRGFSVDPVYSSKKIPADVYASKLSKLNWVKVDDEEQLYTIMMPGKPSAYDMFGQAMKMKMFFDLPTMTVFMTGHTIGRFDSNADAERMLMTMIERMGGLKSSLQKKPITQTGMKGIDGSFDYSGGGYRIQLLQKNNILYLLMMGSSKKSNLEGKDAEKYFNSFKALEPAKGQHALVAFEVPGKAVTVMLPGNPKPNTLIDRQVEKTFWNFHTYDYVDNVKGLYYLVQVRETKMGSIIPGDSTYFSAYEEETKNRMDSTLYSERTTYQGYPALYLDMMSTKDKVIFKTFHVVRGNRVYIIAAGGQEGSDFSELPAIFNSLQLKDYPETVTQAYYGDGYFTSSPGPFHKKEINEEEENQVQEESDAYNENNAVSYQVFKQYMHYLWYPNDSSFFAQQLNNYKEDADSILSHRMTSNGNLKAMEMVIQSQHNNNIKKLRIFVNGDTLYTLMSYMPSQIINDPAEQKFFNDFRVVNEVQPVIYTSRAKELLGDLSSDDSATAAAAFQALWKVNFSKEDLPLLNQAMIVTYADSLEQYGINFSIARLIVPLADSSTLAFISDHYDEVKYNNGSQYEMLHLLSMIKTSESFRLLKKLLLHHPPSSGTVNPLAYSLLDSVQLAKTLYPDVLALSADSIFSDALSLITNRLLDSGQLTMTDILPYHDQWIEAAKKSLKALSSDQDREWMTDHIIQLIARFNDKASNGVLKEFLQTTSNYVKKQAAVCLIKNNQPVSSVQLQKIAADFHYRLDLYNELKELKQLHFFPVTYANQKSLAESELYNVVSDEDWEISRIDFIGERVQMFMGKKQKFYLFKISMDEESNESYLGVAGPYSTDPKQLTTTSDVTGIAGEGFDRNSIDAQLKKHLSDMENWMRKENDGEKLVK